jgi:hypothetical protein
VLQTLQDNIYFFLLASRKPLIVSACPKDYFLDQAMKEKFTETLK